MVYFNNMKFSILCQKWLLCVGMLIITLLGFTTSVQAQENHYVFGTDTTYAPFEFMDKNGEFVGIEMDLLEAIAEDQNFTYEVNILGFNAAVQALESKQVDAVIAGMGITEERKETFDFSTPHYESSLNFAVHADSDIQSLDDLEGKKVSVKTGTSGAKIAEELQDEYGYEISTFEDSVNMYEAVMVGNSDAAIEDYPVMAYAINTGQVDLRILEGNLLSQPFGMAVNKGENQELVEKFNLGLANVRESGVYDEIIQRYLGEEAVALQQQVSAESSGFFKQITNHGSALLNGLWTTIWITFVSFILALILGVIVGIFTVSPNRFLNGVAEIYIDIFRGIPLIVLSFFIYFGIPQLTNINLNVNLAGILTLTINAAAYIAEIVRGGIEAVNKGQREAGFSLGLSYSQTLRHIILPQSFRIMLPSFVNQFIMTMKDTSILSVIGLVELTQTGKIIIARTYQSGSMWMIIGLMYVIVIAFLSRLSKRLEKRTLI